MKKTLLLFIFLIELSTYGQKSYSSYYSSHVKRTFNIDVLDDFSGIYCVSINLYSFDVLHENGNLSIKVYNLQSFINLLDSVAIKYNEWKKVAITNNVKDLLKPMNYFIKADVYFRLDGKLYFCPDVFISVYFKIIQVKDKVNYLLSLETGELVSNNKTSKGLGLIFNTIDEVNNFKLKIIPDSILNYINKIETEKLKQRNILDSLQKSEELKRRKTDALFK